MGKRELLLFLGFLAFGAIVYQATAPPPEPNKEGFSISKFVGQMQAEIKGEPAETRVQRTASTDAPAGTGRLVIPQFRGTLSIVGEDRHDVKAELKAIVYGMDDDQAKARAQDVTLALKEKDEGLSAEIELPKEVHRRPQLELRLHVPKYLGLELDMRNGQADLRQVGDVKIDNGRGKFTMVEVGEIEGSIENGDLEIVHARTATLRLSRTKARLEEIKGELTLEADHGELRLQQLHGPTRLTLQRLECEVDMPHAPLRIEPDHVGLNVRNVSAPLTIKGEHSEVIATLAEAVEVSIETTDDVIDLRTPRGGVTVDARTDNGEIRVAASSAAEPTANDEGKPDTPERPESPEPVERPERTDRRDAHEPRASREHPEPPPPPPPSVSPAHPAMPPMPPVGSRSGQRRNDQGDRAARAQHTMIKLHGGGPLITLRNERGDIVIR